MMTTQSIIGYFIIVAGIISGIATGNVIIIFYGVISGLILVSLARAVGYLQDISERSLGIPLSNRQIRKIKVKSKEMKVISSTLEISPKDASYPLLKLDNDYYVRARALLKYLSQKDRNYTFHFPNREPAVLVCATNYRPDVNMFELDEQVYVKMSKLSELGLIVDVGEESLLIENP